MPEPEEETAQNLWENALDPAPLYELNKVLQADTTLCMDELPQRLNLRDDSEKFWLRALVRAFFSQVEGNLHQMRQIILRAHEVSLIHLTAEKPGVQEHLTARAVSHIRQQRARQR